jgi:hypothetical protein
VVRGVNAAELTDFTRSSDYNDFMRVVWVDPGARVDQITFGIRAFFTASAFFIPPSSPASWVDQFLRYIGNYFRPGQELAVMRCIPSEAERLVLQPILATWPNVLEAITSDLGGPVHDCSSPSLTQGEREICQIAVQYHDTPTTVYTAGLASTFTLAAQLFGTPESTTAIRRDYGIFPAFTGLGFAVKNSAQPVTGATTPFTVAQILRYSIVPEYLLRNDSLADAGCHCLQVPATPELRESPLDPDFIWRNGFLVDGACRRVPDAQVLKTSVNRAPSGAAVVTPEKSN